MSEKLIGFCASCKSCLESQYPLKRSFLGFGKLACPKCGAKAEFPLSKGYRIAYWAVVVWMVALVVTAFAQGGIGYPGLIGVLVIVALVRDMRLRKRVRQGSPQIVVAEA